MYMLKLHNDTCTQTQTGSRMAQKKTRTCSTSIYMEKTLSQWGQTSQQSTNSGCFELVHVHVHVYRCGTGADIHAQLFPLPKWNPIDLYKVWSLKQCKADLTETSTFCKTAVSRVTLTVPKEVTLITWMGKGGGAKTSTGLQLSLLPGPAGHIHSTSIWRENKMYMK